MTDLARGGIALLERLAMVRDKHYQRPVDNLRLHHGQIAAAAQALGVGNCGEHASMAWCLANQKQLPEGVQIWFVDLNRRPDEDPEAPIAPYTDHVFFAIGWPDDPENIVVVDPWQINGRASYAEEFNFPFLVRDGDRYKITPRAWAFTPDGIDYIEPGAQHLDMDSLTSLMDTTGDSVDPALLRELGYRDDHWVEPEDRVGGFPAQVALPTGRAASVARRAAVLRAAFGPDVVSRDDFSELMRRVEVLDRARLRDPQLSGRPLSLEALVHRTGTGSTEQLLDLVGDAAHFDLPAPTETEPSSLPDDGRPD